MGPGEGYDPPHRRWLFIDGERLEEHDFRERALARMDQFWSALAAHTTKLDGHFSGGHDFDVAAFMLEQLGAVHPELMWEFGRALRGPGHRLVITPESATHLRPFVATLLERAPALPSWEFYPYRVPEDLEMAEHTVQARTGGTLAEVRVQVEPTDAGLIDLMFVSQQAGRDPEQAERDAFVAAETLLGEQLLDRWIGRIGAQGLPAKKVALLRWFGPKASEAKTTFALDQLQGVVESAIAAYSERLPGHPHHVWTREASWSLLKLEPKQAEDYPEQDDLFVAKTPNVPLWRAAHAAASFYDERFSRLGETFCYVKLDGSHGVDEEQFGGKGEIEDAIDEVLVPSGLGCQIGGGTGLRYSYVDLALTEAERGISIVRERLRAGNVPRRSWIQFFSSDRSGEWLGIYPDSPPPPQAT